MYIFVWAGDVDTIFRINRVYDIASFQNAANPQAGAIIKSNCWILHRTADSEYFSGKNICCNVRLNVLKEYLDVTIFVHCIYNGKDLTLVLLRNFPRDNDDIILFENIDIVY